jgi:hypothetical protein
MAERQISIKGASGQKNWRLHPQWAYKEEKLTQRLCKQDRCLAGILGESMKVLSWWAVAVPALLLCACVTNIEPSVKSNPPPTVALRQFAHFDLMPLAASKDAQSEKDALTKIDAHLHEQIPALTKTWDGVNAGGHTLKIEPYVTQLKFVDGGTRFFAGAFAGSSAVVMQLKLTDETTNEVVAQPEFFQRAAAMGGAWSIGGTDNGMLERIAGVAEDYLKRNYENPIGGPTGADPE